jgi:hypothetical protein
MATETTRTIVLTYLAGDCGGLFLLSCCRQKQIHLLNDIKFISKRVERQKPTDNNTTQVVEEDKKTSVETGNEFNQTPSGTYPTIECKEVGLSVSGVLHSIYYNFLSHPFFLPLAFPLLFLFFLVFVYLPFALVNDMWCNHIQILSS